MSTTWRIFALAAILVASALLSPRGGAQSDDQTIINLSLTDENTGAPVTNGGGTVLITDVAPYPAGDYSGLQCEYTVGTTGKGSCSWNPSGTDEWANVSFSGSGYETTNASFQVTVYP